MRGVAKVLLVLLAFSIPWEYSLDFGPPLGNVSRILAVLLLLALIPALLHGGALRRAGPLVCLVVGLFVWLGFSCLWSSDPVDSLREVRGVAQVLMIVWFAWELVDGPRDLRNLLLACLGGGWVLAFLTIRDFVSATSAEQIRFVAEGQDPNDVARYLVLGLPVAALFLSTRGRWPGKVLAAGYLPLGLVAVLLTGSRSGFLSVLLALAGCAVLFFQGWRRAFTRAVYALPVFAAGLWFLIPSQTLERIASITTELQGGDLNQRSNIWDAGWLAFAHAPFFGYGVGSFVGAAGLSSIDTAHNTALSYAVEGGVVALLLAAGIFVVSAVSAVRLRGPLRIALASSLAALLLSSLIATVQESRYTWLLLALIAATDRLTREQPLDLDSAFELRPSHVDSRLTSLQGAGA